MSSRVSDLTPNPSPPFDGLRMKRGEHVGAESIAHLSSEAVIWYKPTPPLLSSRAAIWHRPAPPLFRRGLGGGLAAVLLLTFVLGTSAWAGYPMQVKDARGKLVTVSRQPQRIVSISPAFTEILYSLKLDSKVVGVTRFCNYPASAKKKPKVGDMNTSAEAVLALKPDLVVALAYANDAAVAQLDKLGLTVFTIDPKTIEQTTRDIRTVGRITGSSKAAEAVIRQMKGKIATARKQRAGKPKLSVLAVVQPSPLWAAGPKTFVDEMIRLANAENVARDARPGFVTFSKELAISRNPDVIVVGQRGEIEYFLKSPQWRRTKAVKNKRVYVINSDLMMRAGPRLADGLLELAKKLNGG